MKLTNKIQAYTLTEIVVVLILTSIVVGLAFSVLTMVQKHMNSIQNNFSQSVMLNKLEQSLWIDFNRYSDIEFDEVENQLKFKTEMDSISYQFKENYIIKEKDTFNLQLNNKTIFFNGNEIEKGGIDAIKIETSKEFQNQHLFVFKQNDAKQFLN